MELERLYLGQFPESTDLAGLTYAEKYRELSESHFDFFSLASYFKENMQLLGRFQTLFANDLGVSIEELVFGYNFWPTELTEIQLNYIVNFDRAEPKHHRLLVNFQVAF